MRQIICSSAGLLFVRSIVQVARIASCLRSVQFLREIHAHSRTVCSPCETVVSLTWGEVGGRGREQQGRARLAVVPPAPRRHRGAARLASPLIVLFYTFYSTVYFVDGERYTRTRFINVLLWKNLLRTIPHPSPSDYVLLLLHYIIITTTHLTNANTQIYSDATFVSNKQLFNNYFGLIDKQFRSKLLHYHSISFILHSSNSEHTIF